MTEDVIWNYENFLAILMSWYRFEPIVINVNLLAVSLFFAWLLPSAKSHHVFGVIQFTINVQYYNVKWKNKHGNIFREMWCESWKLKKLKNLLLIRQSRNYWNWNGNWRLLKERIPVLPKRVERNRRRSNVRLCVRSLLLSNGCRYGTKTYESCCGFTFAKTLLIYLWIFCSSKALMLVVEIYYENKSG